MPPKDEVHFNMQMPESMRDAIEEERLRIRREERRAISAGEVVRIAIEEYLIRKGYRRDG